MKDNGILRRMVKLFLIMLAMFAYVVTFVFFPFEYIFFGHEQPMMSALVWEAFDW